MSSLVGCTRCGHASPAQARFCERCSAPLAFVPQGKPHNVGLTANQKLLIGVVSGVCVLGLLAVALGLLDDKRKAIVNSNQPADNQPMATAPDSANQQKPAELATQPPDSSTTAPFISERDYAIYREATQSSESEAKVYLRLAKKYNTTSQEIKATVERVTVQIDAGNSEKNREKEQKVRAAIEPLAGVKAIVVSGEFASISYIDKSRARNDADVKEKVLAGMPKILEAAFSVPVILRVRLIANFPTLEGGDLKVAGLEADRSDFKMDKLPQEYREFWVK